MLHFMYGHKRTELSSLFGTLQFLILQTMSFSDTLYYINDEEHSITATLFIFVIPFIIFVKYVCFNMFVSIMYYGYGEAKSEV